MRTRHAKETQGCLGIGGDPLQFVALQQIVDDTAAAIPPQ